MTGVLRARATALRALIDAPAVSPYHEEMAARGARRLPLFSSMAAVLAIAACGLRATGTGAGEVASGGDASSEDATSTTSMTAEDGSASPTNDATAPNDAGHDAAAGDDASDDATAPTNLTPDFAWYLLSETSGLTAHDSTAHKYDVTLGPSVTWSNGAHFTGTTSGGVVIVDASFRAPPVTISAWLTPAARSDHTANTHGIVPFPENAVSGDMVGQFGYGIGLNVWTDGTPGSAAGVEDIADDVAVDAGFVASDEYLLTAVIDAATSSIYVNGAKVASDPTKLPGTPTIAASLRLGYHNEDPGYDTKRFYEGSMRDVRVWKRALSDGEVALLFSQGPATSK